MTRHADTARSFRRFIAAAAAFGVVACEAETGEAPRPPAARNAALDGTLFDLGGAPAITLAAENDLKSPAHLKAGLQAQEGDGPRADLGPDGPLIAYAHRMDVQAPGRAVADLAEMHAQACKAAGRRVCEVTSLVVTPGDPRGLYANARLSVRAAPDWLDDFRARIAGDVEAKEGRILQRSSDAQDLTADIVDMEARLKVQEALRTRLTALLDRAGASVEDLVRVERELARVQATIDAQAARARAFRSRVEKSRLEVGYAALGPDLDPPGFFDPLWDEMGAVAGAFSDGLRTFARLAAFAAPWAALLIAGLWIWRRRRRSARP